MAEIKNRDMPDELAQFVITAAEKVVELKSDCLEIGQVIRDSLGEKQPGNWQCIVSDSDFASLIRYAPDSYIKLKIQDYYILLFKA